MVARRSGRGKSRPGVYQRRGRWYWTINVKDPVSGQWRKKWSHAFDSQEAAWNDRVEVQRRQERGEWTDPGRLTVGEYLDRWEASRPVGFGMRATTANTYGHQLDWARPRIGHVLLRELTPEHLRVLYRDLLEGGAKRGKPLSVASVQGVHRVLHKAFDDAVEDGLLFRNPVARVKRPVGDRRPEMRTWTLEHALAFLAAIQDDRLYAMWFLFLTTGLRRGEVAGLRWLDVNLTTGSIAVRSQRTTVDHAVVVNDPKTPTSRAPVAIDSDVVNALRRHERQQELERLLLGDGWQDSGLVFGWADGRPYHPQHITRMCKRLSEQAGVPAVTPHDLRHTCASLLVEAGIPLKVVQERLRHASYSTTADLYAHVGGGIQQEAAKTIETILRPTAGTG